MATITLVRHGQASFGAANYDQLSEKGILQAQRLGLLFKQQNRQFAQVWIGGMQRHQQTAMHCLSSAERTQELKQHAGFNEFDHEQILQHVDKVRFPDKASLLASIVNTEQPKQALLALFSQAVKRWQSGIYDEDYTESWQQFQRRCIQALDDVVKQCQEQQEVIVFTSGGVISALVQSILQLSDTATYHLNLSLVNGGLTQIKITADGYRLLTLNEQQYLYSQDQHFLTWY